MMIIYKNAIRFKLKNRRITMLRRQDGVQMSFKNLVVLEEGEILQPQNNFYKTKVRPHSKYAIILTN